MLNFENMVEILHTPLWDKDLSTLVNGTISICLKNAKKNNYIICASDAHVLVKAKRDKYFGNIIKSFYLNIPDGIPGVWLGKLKGSKEMGRCYGPEYFKKVLIKSKDKNINHYFCGGAKGIAEKLKTVMENKYGNRNIVGIYMPPFRDLDEEEIKKIANDIDSKNTDFVWVGLSTPKQQIFAKRLSQYTNVYFICTVGAAFDFLTDNVQEAPLYIQKIGLEWLFRLLMEPKRLWKRYFTIVPLFIYYNLVEFLGGKFFNNYRKE